MNKLRKIRIAIATFSLITITLLFLDFTGTIHNYFAWLAQIQLIPAIIALNIGILISLILLTLLFGRIYCSVICPLGICQDAVSRVAKKIKKNRFTFSPAKNKLRYILLGVFILAFIKLGAHNIVAILDPYSAYGRIVSAFLSPIYLWGNNLLAGFAEQADSYAFYKIDIWLQSHTVFILASITLLAVSILAFRNGRTYCNTICPVGTFLGFASKFSIYKHRIDTNKCSGCGLCAKNCKASCINTEARTVDYSRCVSCFNCLKQCNKNAMIYNRNSKLQTVNSTEKNDAKDEKINTSLRTSLATVGTFVAGSVVASTVKAQVSSVDGGFIFLEDKIEPIRQTPIVPPGAKSIKHFRRNCSSCQLCVTVCKNNVLKTRDGIVPDMGFERGYCRPECVKCSEVCPTNAISKITVEEKSSLQIGYAVWIKENCVVLTDDVSCGNCERHCPVGAIDMIEQRDEDDDIYEIPTVNTEICIGCGACEFLCPARPNSAIYVEGVNVQRIV
jgi:polyferredoxin